MNRTKYIFSIYNIEYKKEGVISYLNIDYRKLNLKLHNPNHIECLYSILAILPISPMLFFLSFFPPQKTPFSLRDVKLCQYVSETEKIPTVLMAITVPRLKVILPFIYKSRCKFNFRFLRIS